ncbi:MAG: hypothetical protein FWD57_00725 [Polyangiaceae bacterium]|nr:hypothetical protein [Polyangiaceae bacterium]
MILRARGGCWLGRRDWESDRAGGVVDVGCPGGGRLLERSIGMGLVLLVLAGAHETRLGLSGWQADEFWSLPVWFDWG